MPIRKQDAEGSEGRYNTALALQPFATILWIVVGLCLAIDRATAPAPRG